MERYHDAMLKTAMATKRCYDAKVHRIASRNIAPSPSRLAQKDVVRIGHHRTSRLPATRRCVSSWWTGRRARRRSCLRACSAARRAGRGPSGPSRVARRGATRSPTAPPRSGRSAAGCARRRCDKPYRQPSGARAPA